MSLDPPETFRIQPYTAGGGRVTGGDLRGLMYGLIEAAGQMKSLGHLKAVHGAPTTPLRAVRFVAAAADLDQPWYTSEAFWRTYFQTLARSRFNRINLALPRLPDTSRVCGLSQLAASYGLDFTLGLPEPAGDPVALRSRLTNLLATCPLIRGLEMDGGNAPLEYYREAVLRTIETAGRRVTLDLRNATERIDLNSLISHAVLEANLPVRLSSPSGCKDVTGLPEGSCYWALREPVGAEAESIRLRVPDLNADGSSGFEIEAPRDENDAPSVFHGAQEMFYWVWGRLSYDPRSPAAPPVEPPPAPKSPAPAKPAVTPPKPTAPKPASSKQ